MAEQEPLHSYTPWNPKAIADAKNETSKDQRLFACFATAGVPSAILEAAEAGKYSVLVVIPNKDDCFGRLDEAEIMRNAFAFLRVRKIEGVSVSVDKGTCIVTEHEPLFITSERVMYSPRSLQIKFTW
jgi:hypothetical protein